SDRPVTFALHLTSNWYCRIWDKNSHMRRFERRGTLHKLDASRRQSETDSCADVAQVQFPGSVMTSISKQPGGPASSGHSSQDLPGSFLTTLCRVSPGVPTRPPQSPHLKPFKFFTSRARHTDGSELLHLHMGYFGTQEQAEKWAGLMRS